MSFKHKVKTFFRNKDTSETSVELLRHFILPFMRLWNPNASVDDAIAAFFAVNERRFYHGTAKKPFMMPGHLMKAGDRVSRLKGPRNVTKGQYMLLAVDRKDQNARIDIKIAGKDKTFKLSRAEMEFLKDYVEIRDA